MTIVKALKALYERLGGTPSDVADATRAVDVLNAIAALYDGASNATHIAKAIANIVAVASGLIKPSGTKSITTNGSDIDVTEYAAVNVNVPQPSGTISITENGSDIDVAQYATANVGVQTFANEIISIIDGSAQMLVLPSGVTAIRQYAFYNYSDLESVTIPSGVVSINAQAFQGCTGLTSVTIPSGVNYIGERAFQGCTGLTSVTIPSGVITLQGELFAQCSNLASVTIPSSVTTIRDYAFNSCTALTTLIIPSSVTKMGAAVFTGSGLTDIYYTGTQQQWEAITGLSSAGIPQDCTIHYEHTPS